jgi:hypothetical protein
MHVGADTKITLTKKNCVIEHQQIVDTVIHTYIVVHTPKGGNTVNKLNKSKSSGHVNILTLVLPLVPWWIASFFWQWTMMSLTMVVVVAVVVAWWQWQWWRWQ